MKHLNLILALLLAISMVSCGGYSDGKRTGKLTKFSKKGLIKTFEGELMMGETGDSNWEFSVTDMSVAKKLLDSQGKDMTLHYDQMYFHLPWKSETDYIVTKVEIIQ